MKKLIPLIVPFWMLSSACSDATQFAEQVIPASSNADPGSTSINPNKPDGVTTAGKTTNPSETSVDPRKTSEDPNLDPNDTGSGTVYDGTDPGAETGTTANDPIDDAGQSAQSKKNLFSSCEVSSAPIVAQVYNVPVNSSKLPNFTTLAAVDEVCVEQLNITDRAFTEGFPGVPDLIEWFGLDLRFRIYAPSQGAYTFTLRSDDGSILSIDGKTVVNNDGLHSVTEKAGVVALTKGYHDVEVRYYQGPRYRIALELLWTQPGASKASYIPATYLARPQ